MIHLRGVVVGPGGTVDGFGRWLDQPGAVHVRSGRGALSVATDRTYRVEHTASGMAIHDGRVSQALSDEPGWNGSFLGFSAHEQGWHCRSDRLGSVALFWCRVTGGTAFASRLVDLLALCPAEPDPIGILQAITLNQPLAPRTVIAGVSLAPPASRFDITETGLVGVERYWWPTISHEPRGNTADLIDQGIATLRDANERLFAPASGPTAWPVTAGADSRCCLAVNRSRLAADDVLFHVTELGNYEYPIANEVARALGRELHVFDPTAAISALLTSDPYQETGELHPGQWFLAPAARSLAEQGGCRSIVDGYLMDSLLKPSRLRSGSPEAVRDAELGRIRYRMRRLGRAGDSARVADAMEAAAADFPVAVGGTATVQRYVLENRSRRLLLGHARLQGNDLDVRMPGLDHGLIDFAMDLPLDCRLNGWLYRRIINALEPALGRIRQDRTGRPLISEKTPALQRRLLGSVRQYAHRALPASGLFITKESRFERLLRTRRDYRHALYEVIEQSSWLAEAISGSPTAALEYQRESGGLISDMLGNMLQIAQLEACANGKPVDREKNAKVHADVE